MIYRRLHATPTVQVGERGLQLSGGQKQRYVKCLKKISAQIDYSNHTNICKFDAFGLGFL